MMNNPKSEPYYSYLIRLGYVFCNYSKDCAPSYLVQVLCLMQETTNIKGKSFGMMERNGQARFLSWKDFLYSVVDRMPERERAENRCKIEVMPEITESSFIFTDCNMANFVFNMGLVTYFYGHYIFMRKTAGTKECLP